MPQRTAEAKWSGGLMEGKGSVRVQSGTLDAPYDFRGRTGDGKGTNPEELIGAAHAGCFTMQLAAMLEKAGTPATSLHTKATVHFEKKDGGFHIPTIELALTAKVPGLDAAGVKKHAEAAKSGCPVSKALAGVDIVLKITGH